MQIDAADHFVCRLSHGVPPERFCPHLLEGRTRDDDDLSQQFASLREATLSHLTARFHAYYSNEALLGELVGPALSDVLTDMETVVATAATAAPRTKPFRVYSCHDVTILALLYALSDRYGGSEPPVWPAYATTLTLELVQQPPPHNDSETRGDDERSESSFGTTTTTTGPSWFVRAWLSRGPDHDAEPRVPVAIVARPDEAPETAIALSRFETLVQHRNDAREQRFEGVV